LIFFDFNFTFTYLELAYISVAGESHAMVAAAGKQISKEEGENPLMSSSIMVAVRFAAEAAWTSSSVCAG